MNLPNKLTILRILLIPFFVIVAYIPYLNENTVFASVTYAELIIVIIFIVAAITDYFDGLLARKLNQVTTFGKFIDPLADKLLVLAAFVLLVKMGRLDAWIVIVILSREFMVTSIRILAAAEGVIFAAKKSGKYKALFQFIMIPLLFLNNYPFSELSIPMDQIFVYLALGMTIISGIDYFNANKEIVLRSK